MEGPKRNQKVLAPSYGLRCAQVPSLRSCSVGTPPRAIHGPVAALPASMPVDPLLSTSSRPPGRAGRSKTLRPEAADRPACSVRVCCAIAAAAIETLQLWERACSRRSFASRLAPTIGLDCNRVSTEIAQYTRTKQAGRSAASVRSAFDLPAPSGGREEVLRSGSTGMDAGRAAMGQGWPVAAGPRSRTGAREPERSEGRTPGQAFLVTFSASGKSDSL